MQPTMHDVTQWENLDRAFWRVEAAKGMAGVDGVTVGAFRRNLQVNLSALAEELSTGTYRPLPLLRLLVAKRDGSPRALSVPAVRDRTAQAAVLHLIEPLCEAQFEDVSFGYRKGRSVRQAAYRVKALRERGYRYIVDADIDAFFDEIDHSLLLDRVRSVVKDAGIRRIIELWIRAEVYDGEKIYKLEKGIPQGSVISPILANLFLDSLDDALTARGLQMVRYADDFIVMAKTPEGAQRALRITTEVLDELHLALDTEDTQVTDFARGFEYLGLIFVGDSIMAPFDRAPRPRKVLFVPPPFDLAAYLRERGG